MKILQSIFLLLACFVFFACEDLTFTNEDVFPSKTKEEKNKEETDTLKTIERGQDKKTLNKIEEEQIFEEETTILSEDLELSENTLIQNKKVVLDMVSIQTLQYDLTILADEFVSNHSFIRNFPEGQTAKKKENGRSGGHVLIKAKRAKGNLGLILSGENGGFVPRRKISRSERAKLSGRSGENGYDAVYDTWCRDFYIPLWLGVFGGKIVLDRDCWLECRVNPTRGENGEDGRQGYPGYIGKKGGDSGSFHLQAFSLSDFHLTEVKKTPGLGSRGGKGSPGGYGGERGKNGRDRKNLCSSRLPRTYKGKKGERGRRGKDGTNGIEGAICLEHLKTENQEAQINIEKTSLETNNRKSENNKIEIKCNEEGSRILCHEVLLEKKLQPSINKKENVVCY